MAGDIERVLRTSDASPRTMFEPEMRPKASFLYGVYLLHALHSGSGKRSGITALSFEHGGSFRVSTTHSVQEMKMGVRIA